tara:strand:+ start:59 stop:607 length:549 start_codon:yes stop_codon:yes gene_type:complete
MIKRYKRGLFLILLSFVLASCNLNEYQKLQFDKNKYYFSFENEVPKEFQSEIEKIFGDKFDKVDDKKIRLNINSFDINKYNVYSGTALRAMEIELKAKLVFSITNAGSMKMDHSMHTDHSGHMEHSTQMNHSNNAKTINSMKRFSAIELNPLAENEMNKFMEKEIMNDVIEQLILEVNLIDL